MQPITRAALLLLTVLPLTHCQKAAQPEQPAAPVTGAQDALSWTGDLMVQSVISGLNMPGAPLGMYVASYLIDSMGSHLQSATDGVTNGLSILLENQEKPTATFELLQALGVILQVNVPDTLNRSTDRQKTLDSYIDTLTKTLAKSQAQLTALKQQQSDLQKEQHDKRAAVAQIQHDLNNALQKQDYTTASTKQSAIIDAKAAQSKVEAQVNQLQSTIDLYTNLNKVADKRLKAIAANRLILIAGLQVVDVPGIDDLNILKDPNKRDSTNNTNPFGP